MRLAGSLGIKGKVRFDTARLDRDFQLDWDVSNTCRVVEAPPELSVDRFKRAFRRKAYGPYGQPVEVESGPGTPGWVQYQAISRFMEVAVLTTEDSGFPRHRGFDDEAIKNSIRENLRRRRFVRGASTISMQLAKNLYLERTKSVARKLQEAVLTMYLEQELTKEQLMELYLNVVEFGPMVFGVGAAARHYFNTTASQLSLGQALYMSSILPNPRVQHFTAGGAVSPGWSNYLRKLMELANKRQWITEEELEEGLRETVVRGSPVPLRAPASAAPGEAADAPGEGGDTPPAPEEDGTPEGGGWLGP
jgi:membrane peptidoglycan carboxypeptidase